MEVATASREKSKLWQRWVAAGSPATYEWQAALWYSSEYVELLKSQERQQQRRAITNEH